MEEERTRYLYWLDASRLREVRSTLQAAGFDVRSALLTPCQALKCSGDVVYVASPEVWTRMCRRQASWFLESERAGQLMLMSARRLPRELDPFLDAELSPSEFRPERLPSREELLEIVESKAYRARRPRRFEGIGWRDAWMFKIFFTLTRFWKRGDDLRRHWLGHRANHANFLAKRYTTELEGEEVAYSVTPNASVCSSCAEFFNVVAPDERKLVRACPGSVVFGGAPRNVYLDVKPVRISV